MVSIETLFKATNPHINKRLSLESTNQQIKTDTKSQLNFIDWLM
jgi:hypothetical protein